MHAASTLLIAPPIASLDKMMVSRTSLFASAATCQTGLQGMIRSRASCAGLGTFQVRLGDGGGRRCEDFSAFSSRNFHGLKPGVL